MSAGPMEQNRDEAVRELTIIAAYPDDPRSWGEDAASPMEVARDFLGISQAEAREELGVR